jgi:hypothetical protein
MRSSDLSWSSSSLDPSRPASKGGHPATRRVLAKSEGTALTLTPTPRYAGASRVRTTAGRTHDTTAGDDTGYSVASNMTAANRTSPPSGATLLGSRSWSEPWPPRDELSEAEQYELCAADDLAGVFKHEAPVFRRERLDLQPFEVAPRCLGIVGRRR